MLRIVGMGRRQWVYYVRDVAKFMNDLNSVLATEGSFPIEIYQENDLDWEYWNSFVLKCKD